MSLASADIDFLRELVAHHSGNVIAPRQVYMLEQRLAPVAGDHGLNDVASLVAKLRRSSDKNLSTEVAEAVTVNETSFYRDAHVFDSLSKHVIPELIERHKIDRTIRIWSAACSSGQEPYTLAMMIRDRFPQLEDWNIKIVATDLSEEMLRKCRSGEYTQLEVNRGLPVKQLVRFFDRNGNLWRAKPQLRDMIQCQRLNLTQQWSLMGSFDVVLIRNVLIYFDQKTKSDILQRVHRSLRPDGYLFIGSAETMIGLGVPYQRETIDATVCYRPTNR
ncbi:MAG: protein-glutamate O-methyltransferase CheR [Planctomycetota bacterium]